MVGGRCRKRIRRKRYDGEKSSLLKESNDPLSRVVHQLLHAIIWCHKHKDNDGNYGSNDHNIENTVVQKLYVVMKERGMSFFKWISKSIGIEMSLEKEGLSRKATTERSLMATVRQLFMSIINSCQAQEDARKHKAEKAYMFDEEISMKGRERRQSQPRKVHSNFILDEIIDRPISIFWWIFKLSASERSIERIISTDGPSVIKTEYKEDIRSSLPRSSSIIHENVNRSFFYTLKNFLWENWFFLAMTIVPVVLCGMMKCIKIMKKRKFKSFAEKEEDIPTNCNRYKDMFHLYNEILENCLRYKRSMVNFMQEVDNKRRYYSVNLNPVMKRDECSSVKKYASLFMDDLEQVCKEIFAVHHNMMSTQHALEEELEKKSMLLKQKWDAIETFLQYLTNGEGKDQSEGYYNEAFEEFQDFDEVLIDWTNRGNASLPSN